MPISFQHRPGLVAYITCGDPSLSASRDIAIAALHAGADVIELGVPFSDPVADGPIIQRASERALRNGADLRGVLDVAREVRAQAARAGIVIFSYLNPIWQLGLEKFCDAAAQAGVDGALVTDLPVEEGSDYIKAMKAHKLAPVFLAAPTSTDERLRAVARNSRGFIYAISRTGITGTRQALDSDAQSLVSRIRQVSKLPVAVGFGISTREQFQQVGEFADAAVVGSAIVQRVEENAGREAAAVAEFISSLTGKAQRAATEA